MHNRYWFLLSKKITGNASDAEIAELDDLLQEHPDWLFSAEQVSHIWEAETSSTANEDDFSAHVSRMEKLGHDTAIFSDKNTAEIPAIGSSKRRVTRSILLAAACVSVLLAAWLVMRPSAKNPAANLAVANENVILTKSGNRRKMILPDGTQVWLNAASKLTYGKSFGKANRDVSLSGEAYFDVVKNAELPFIIQTDKIRIKVTGTAFNVKAYPGDKVSETSIIRGRVEVTINERPDEKYILKPNEKLVVRNEPLVKLVAEGILPAPEKKMNHELPLIQLGYLNYIENDSAAVETSWVYDRLIFDNETFEEIAGKMERWYGVKIAIADNQLALQRLTYTIKKETISQALRNMQYALRFNYSIAGDNITITK